MKLLTPPPGIFAAQRKTWFVQIFFFFYFKLFSLNWKGKVFEAVKLLKIGKKIENKKLFFTCEG